MTILFPDVSEYTPNVDPARYPVLIARATLSDWVSDPTYAGFKAKAQAAGTVFAAYHWLNHGNLQRQAAWCFQHVGPGTPVMIDAEDEPGNTGYNGPLTVDDLLGFKAEYLALGGGPVNLGYLPDWYWSGPMGAPHRLGELEAAGIHLVSSNYPNAGYTDNGPGWAPYYPGAPVPVQWQYTSTPIDMNAFRGTAAEFAQLVGAGMTPEEHAEIIAGDLTDENVLHWRLRGIQDQDDPAIASTKLGRPSVPGLRQIADKIDAIETKLAALSTPAPAVVDTHAVATDVVQQLQAAGLLTADVEHTLVHAEVKSALDTAFGAAAAA